MAPLILPVLSDGELSLGPVGESQAHELADLVDLSVLRYFYEPDELPGHPSAPAAWARQRHVRQLEGSAADFAITLADRSIGWVALHHLDWELAHGTAGYWLGTEYRGHGYATRALRIACDFGFQELQLERISLQSDVGNRASRAVAERLGFSLEGVLRSWKLRGAARVDQALYSLLPGELKPAREPAAEPAATSGV